MQGVRSFLTVAAAAAALTFVAPSLARADEANQLTYLTFNAPVEVPGVVLPAGTYMFKLNDSSDLSGDTVRVYNRDGSKLYATFFAIPEQRDRAKSKPVVVLEKSSPAGPEAIKSWFYPDELTGHEFVYPQPEARMIAEANPASTHRAD